MGKKGLAVKQLAFLPLLSVIVLILSGCRAIELKSGWRTQAINIDGDNSEWHNALYFIEKATVLVGFINDEADLYACLVTDNPYIRSHILRQGLTVWFDPDGGSKKTFGLRFPLGRERERDRGRERPGEQAEALGAEPFGQDVEPDLEETQEFLDQALKDVGIIEPGQNQAKRMPVAEVPGIEIKLVPSKSLLVYELKVPLARSPEHPYALGAAPGRSIGVGLETTSFSLRLGGRMPGGMGGRPSFGGLPGGGGFGGEPMMSELPKELKLWAKVSLAANPGAK